MTCAVSMASVLVGADGAFRASRKGSRLNQVLPGAELILIVEQFAAGVPGPGYAGAGGTSARNSSERMEMSGFFNPAAAKMSMTSSGSDGTRDDLPNGMIHGHRRRAPIAGGLDDGRANCLKEANIIADGHRLRDAGQPVQRRWSRRRHNRGSGFDHLRARMCSWAGEKRQLFGGGAGHPVGPVKAVEKPQTNLDFLHEQTHSLFWSMAVSPAPPLSV